MRTSESLFRYLRTPLSQTPHQFGSIRQSEQSGCAIVGEYANRKDVASYQGMKTLRRQQLRAYDCKIWDYQGRLGREASGYEYADIILVGSVRMITSRRRIDGH